MHYLSSVSVILYTIFTENSRKYLGIVEMISKCDARGTKHAHMI